MKKLIYIFLFSMILINCEKPKDLSLEDFIFGSNDLSETCTLVPYDDSFPFGIQSNPFISSDPEFLDLFTTLLFKDSTLSKSVHSVLFSLYFGKNEFGLNGTEFDSDSLANRAAEILKIELTDTFRFAVFNKGRIVLQLWRDDNTDSCFYELEELVRYRLK